MFRIKIPSSTANLGPGFDCLGLALGVYLSVTVRCAGEWKLGYSGEGEVPLDYTLNYITRVAIYVANAHFKSLPPMHIDIDNPIPLGRGMGSSGSAVVCGIAIANAVLNLELSTQQILDYACFMEGHPDNIAPSLYGGLVASYMRFPVDAPVEDGFSVGTPTQLPVNLTHATLLQINPRIRIVMVIPDFKVATVDARNALPSSYTRKDVVFNISRVASLVTHLCRESLDAQVISESMQDMVHQPYRDKLVPGLAEILRLKPSDLPGMLGICLSGTLYNQALARASSLLRRIRLMRLADPSVRYLQSIQSMVCISMLRTRLSTWTIPD